MSILQYEVFVTVVETKSFTKASEKLGYTQSAVSQMISGLEKDLGVKLLNRSRQGITTTKIGERMLKHVRDILKITELMNQEAARYNGYNRGTVRIGAIPSVSAKILPGLIGAFERQYPGVSVILFEGDECHVERWILEDEVDVGFLYESGPDFEFIPLLDDGVTVFAPMNTIFKEKENLSITEIKDYSLIMPKPETKFIRSLFEQKGISPLVRYEIQDVLTILSMVQEGIGVAILPNLSLPNQLPNVKALPLAEPVNRKVGVGLKNMDEISPVAAEFVLLAKERCLKEKAPYFT